MKKPFKNSASWSKLRQHIHGTPNPKQNPTPTRLPPPEPVPAAKVNKKTKEDEQNED
jgi:hypothetical protein